MSSELRLHCLHGDGGLGQEGGQNNARSPSGWAGNRTGPGARADSEAHLRKHARKPHVHECSAAAPTNEPFCTSRGICCVRQQHIDRWKFRFLERRTETDSETREEWRGERRAEARMKESRSPKAIDNTYGVGARGDIRAAGEGDFS